MLNVDVDTALHMVIGAFLEGESKMLADTADKRDTIRVVDDHGTESWAKLQMCTGPGQDKIPGSVSRSVESGHSVVLRHPG